MKIIPLQIGNRSRIILGALTALSAYITIAHMTSKEKRSLKTALWKISKRLSAKDRLDGWKMICELAEVDYRQYPAPFKDAKPEELLGELSPYGD